MLSQALDSNPRKRRRTAPAAGPSPKTATSIIHEAQRMFEGASDCKIEKSVMMNVHGDATIFNIDGTNPDNILRSGFAEPDEIIGAIDRSMALLMVLGAPATESPNVDEGITSGRKVLENHCNRLGELIRCLMEKGAGIPLPLKNGLNELHRELTILAELLHKKEDPTALEGASRKIVEAANRVIKESTDRVEDLPRVCAAFNDFTSKNRRRDTCFKGTREELLEEIKDWVAPQKDSVPATKDLVPKDSRFFLISGIAGIGKSTVAQTIAEWAHDLGYLGASFFFSRDQEEHKTAKHFFTSIAYQLCIHDEECALLIGGVLQLKVGMDVIKSTKDPMTQLNVLLLKPLRNIKPRSQATAIVVDALDECTDDYGELVLQGLMKMVEELEFIKVILTTRPQPHLEPTLDNLGTHRIVYLHKIDEKVVDGDIKRYLEHHLSEKQVKVRLRRPWNACGEEIETLVRGAGRLFIIASTAVLFILDRFFRNPQARMKLVQSAFEAGRTPFESLNDFYTTILRSAVPIVQPSVAEWYQTVVGAIVLVQTPLPVETLAKLIGIDSSNIYGVLDNLQSVILLSAMGDVPVVYHKSFPDYLMDAKRCTDQSFRIVPEVHHTRLSICCLQTMNRQLKHNILDLGEPAWYFDNKEALVQEGHRESEVQRAIPPELQYAVVHWANHIKHANPKDNVLVDALKKFCTEHLLHWLEALSWIRKLGSAHSSLDVISKFQILDSGMCQIFSDAFRFTSRHYYRIEQSALYTYHSALPFTPTESLLYKTFKTDMIHDVEGGPVHWDALIARLHHGTDNCRATFSADSSQLASWDDEVMKVWNAVTGTLIRAFKSSKVALANDFSTVALSVDSSVTVCRVSSGVPITDFDPPGTVVELALSFDGSRLASGLKSDFVCVWDVGNRKSIASFPKYDCRQLKFSPSGYILAVMARYSVSLWNEKGVTRLEHEAEEPVEILFSSDGTRLASLAEEGITYNLRLWNGENGDFVGVARNVGWSLGISADGSLLATWRDEAQLWSGDSLSLVETIPTTSIKGTKCLAFSANSDILAIATSGDVTVYDVKTHASISTLRITSPVSIAFSPNGTRLTAANRYGDVSLWDVQTVKASAPTSGRQQTYVSSLAFSPDGSRLACGFGDGAIELWDTIYPKKMIARHTELHWKEVTALAFSPDGNELASGTGFQVNLWNGKDGTPTGTLLHSLSSPRSMAFSCRSLAVATINDITLWDRKSRCLIRMLSRSCRSLAFSLDDSMLVFVENNEDDGNNANNDEYTSRVTVWDTWKWQPTTTFKFDSYVPDLFLSPDGSTFAIRTAGTLKFFKILSKKPIESLEFKDLNWVPHLNGIPISRTPYEYDLVGWFSAHHDRVPVLWIPREFYPRHFTGGPSILALGTYDGRILLIRPATKINALV